MSQLPLFVYGTLKPGGAAFTAYLSGRVAAHEAARLPAAALYSDGRYAYLVLDAALAGAGGVAGMLLSLLPERYAETLALLDEYEEAATSGVPGLYERVPVIVECSGRATEAWAYVAGPAPLEAIRAGRFARVPNDVWGKE